MTPTAFALVLLAALLHASWNLVVKAAPDRLVASWAQVSLGAGVLVPVALAVGWVDGRAWPAVLLSGAIHLLYSLSLVWAYDHGDLSSVYPIARGVAPPLVAVAGIALLGDRIGTLQWAAVGVISGGIIGIGLRGGAGWRSSWRALLVGLSITTYTLVDAAAVRRFGAPFPYTVAVLLLSAVGLTAAVLVRRPLASLRQGLSVTPLRNLSAGMASVGAYALVLAAARIAPVGLVSALREVSVVLGALGGWLLLREPMGARRAAWAGMIAAGVVLLRVT